MCNMRPVHGRKTHVFKSAAKVNTADLCGIARVSWSILTCYSYVGAQKCCKIRGVIFEPICCLSTTLRFAWVAVCKWAPKAATNQ